MGDRWMRVLIFFDLPVTTKKLRRDYAQFRKALLKDGFMMLVPAPQDLVTGEPAQSAIATVEIEMLD